MWKNIKNLFWWTRFLLRTNTILEYFLFYGLFHSLCHTKDFYWFFYCYSSFLKLLSIHYYLSLHSKFLDDLEFLYYLKYFIIRYWYFLTITFSWHDSVSPETFDFKHIFLSISSTYQVGLLYFIGDSLFLKRYTGRWPRSLTGFWVSDFFINTLQIWL